MTPREHALAALKLMVAWMENPMNHQSDSDRFTPGDYAAITDIIHAEQRRMRRRWRQLEAHTCAAPALGPGKDTPCPS